MKWLANTYDPGRHDARFMVTTMYGQTPQEAWDAHVRWLSGKIIGAPQATEAMTVRELERQGMVGVYVADEPATTE